MNKLLALVRQDKRYFIVVTIVLFALFGIALAQNVIRYGIHEGYRPWRSVLYLCFSLLMILPLLPFIYRFGLQNLKQDNSQFWLRAAIIILLALPLYYAITSLLFFAVGFYSEPFGQNYARQYFGREALYHLLILAGTFAYLKLLPQEEKAKTISGTLGRKVITIKAELIHWIEADDHYLRLYTDDNTLMKRSSLEKMAQELKPEFVRIHRKYLVNTQAIIGKEKVQRDEFVILRSGEKLKVGRSFSPIEL